MTVPAAKKTVCALGILFPMLLFLFERCTAGKPEKPAPDAPGTVVESLPSGSNAVETGIRNGDEKERSLRLKLQVISQLLRSRNWGEAGRVYGEALASAAASRDESLRCATLQKAWDFYFLVRRRPVVFSADGLALAGTFYDVPGWTSRQAIILSHGSSAWGQGHPFIVMAALELARLGHEVFTFDYRGFGASQDPRNLDTAAALDFSHDLAAAIEQVKNDKKNAAGRIVLMGHSFGAGPTLACGFVHPDVAALVAVGPARRVRERNLAANASRGIKELRQRLKTSMELNRLPGADAVREVTERMLIDNFAGRTFGRPLLLIDGQNEKPELRKFLADLAATMKGPVTYHSLPGAGHYFGLDAFRDYFKKSRGRAGEIGLDKMARACGEQCDGKVDLALFFRFIADIDAWLRQLHSSAAS